jgi:cysteinyl-tRNA synthetase
MDDDFNSPQAIAVLFDLSRETNALLNLDTKVSASSLGRILDFMNEYGGSLLGILPVGTAVVSGSDTNLEADLLQLLVDLRKDVRTQKLWGLSDSIRDGLKKLGITIEDRKDGTVWRKG